MRAQSPGVTSTNAKGQQRRRQSEYLTGQEDVMVVPIERDIVDGVILHACAGSQVQVLTALQ